MLYLKPENQHEEKLKTQGNHRGNFDLIGVWPPCTGLIETHLLDACP